ncbi:hypothetical protein TSUD_163180 [Trifolium subterraneum]|uniref:DUF1664 domain-containing protein n=1 Tax=Trifolium subterraneum TaxID=3900 RepID=A0A2Z6N5M6_TRISU|nr:hypothetical protein TSUD_163180 [Trifolium subterraneum]
MLLAMILAYFSGFLLSCPLCGSVLSVGWFPDLRFATRRSLNDACTDIGNQLGKVHGSIEDAKRKLSTKVTGVEEIIDRMADDAGKTQADIDAIQRQTELIGGDLKGFQLLIELFKTKLNEMEEKQKSTNHKVGGLCQFVECMENGTTPPQNIQA